MPDEQQVPRSAAENADRIQERPYESAWARLPAEEVTPRPEPGGGGPSGRAVGSGGVSWPLVIVAVGFLIAFTTFAVGTWVPAVTGVALILAGGVWAGARGGHGPGGGLGTVTIEADPAEHRTDPPAE